MFILLRPWTSAAAFVQLPAAEIGLRELLRRYALSNTKKSIESCGILAGSLDSKRGLFTISTLIVPKQEGSSDMVSALNEEEIFDVQDKRSLYPLGWIHTHPSQTCFLSSIDIHTQCGYQVRSLQLRCAAYAHATRLYLVAIDKL